MSIIIKKRQLVTATLVLALSAAVFVNWYYTKPQSPSEIGGESVSDNAGASLGEAQYVNSAIRAGNAMSSDDYFASAEVARSTAHDEALESLRKVISDADASESSLDAANSKLDALAEMIKREVDCQTVISAKTGGRSLVVLNSDGAQVILEKGTVSDSLIIQIKEIVIEQTGVPAEKITIIEVNT